MTRAVVLALALVFTHAHAQDCPPVDREKDKAREAECRAAGGEWARFGVRDHLCGVYSCAERTSDAGKACRGRCAPVKTNFGCFTHVDGGRIVGRVCVD